MSLNWQTLISIGIGGFIGSIARAYAVYYSNKFYSFEFPIGILLVNIAGSFIIGACFAYFSTYAISINLKAFIVIGFLGSLTTFSTFSLDTYIMFGTSIVLAILNIVLNLFGSLFATFLGFKLISLFLK